jgi:hypothetical protein
MLIPSFKRVFSIFSKRRSYNGVVVTPAGRDELWVIDGDRRVNVFAELSHGNVDRVVVRKSISGWEPPHDKDPFSDSDRERILALICRYLDDVGDRFIVE